MASLQKLTAMSDQHSKQRDSLVAALIKALLQLWSGFDRPDDGLVRAGYAAQSASVAQTAVTNARRLERSYVTAVLRELDVPTSGLPSMLNGPGRAGDVTQTDVWQRPVEQWIWARRQAESDERQRGAFSNRLQSLAEEAVIGSSRDEAASLYGAKHLSYRRVIHPELSRDGTCGLCIVASDRVYHSGDLLPLHPGCHCDTMPITSAEDPGLRLNSEDLAKLYADAGATQADALRQTKYRVEQHGELGPVLVASGDHFRTASEADVTKFRRPTPGSVRANQKSELQQLDGLISQAGTAFDSFMRDHPRDSWDPGDQQRAFDLQRAAGQLRIRQSQLQTLLGA